MRQRVTVSEHPLRRYWYDEQSIGCRYSNIRCGGCRCSAPTDGSRCPCCGWQSWEFCCVVCGGKGTPDDSIFQVRGPVHEYRCASSAWLHTVTCDDIWMPEWEKYVDWMLRLRRGV